MEIIPIHRSKNFSVPEIIHRKHHLANDTHVKIAYHVTGILQGFSNYIRVKTGKRARLIPTSGLRTKKHNQQVGGVENSYHTWRIDKNGHIVWAVDLISPDLTQHVLYELAAEFFFGEVYKHGTNGIVHVTDYGDNEDLGELF